MTRLLIRELATQKGLNISTLARKSALAYTTTHALWHDSATIWHRRSLDRVAYALGVRVADLFDGDPEQD